MFHIHTESFQNTEKILIPPHLNPLPCGYSSNGGEEETPSPCHPEPVEGGDIYLCNAFPSPPPEKQNRLTTLKRMFRLEWLP